MSSHEPDISADLTQDDFLGGQLTLRQPRYGYRAGIDPVLLAASVDAKPGQTLLDLGCGVGTAALCAGRRIPGLVLHGLERHPDYAQLARQNGVANALPFAVVEGDLEHMPDAFKSRQFDHVIANPPYFDRQRSTPSDLPAKESALGEDTPLCAWVRHAAKRAAPGGWVTFIHRIDRLPELLSEFQRHLGSLACRPLAPRQTTRPRMFILRGRKGGRAEFRLLTPWVLHAGEHHDKDRENYSPETLGILRNGHPLPSC